MYYSHFGLTQPPFRITPNTEFFYTGGNRGPILEALIYAIGQGEGIIKVTGEVGSGKTMLCSMLQARLPPQIGTVYLANPSVSPDEILHAIAFELQLGLPRDAGRLETMQALHDYLLERHAQGKQVVVFVEESQSMPLATLEEIRLLSNLETATSKLLQIVLFGQPELEDNLRQPHIRQLRERITHSFRLSPLNSGEIRDYLNFRLHAAGYRGPDLFSPAVIRAIAKASAGLTRRINLIADKALLAAFAENTHTLKLKHVRAAVRDSDFSSYEPPQPRLRLGAALSLLAIGAGVGIVLYALFQTYQDRGVPTAPQASSPETRAATSSLSAPSAPPAEAHTTPPPEPAPAAVPAAESEKPLPVPAAPPIATVAEIGPAGAGKGSPAPPVPATTEGAAPAVAAKYPAASASASVAAPASKPVTPIASARLENSPQSADLLDARLVATETWLAQQDKSTYSIQLLGTDNPQQLKQRLNVIGKFVEINEIFVYRTVAKQKPSLTVLYGSFSNRRAALDALAKLPAPLRAYRPYLRTVHGIRAEIALHQKNS